MAERATSSELLELSKEHIPLESSEATSDDVPPKLERIEENDSNPREETSQESNTPASSINRNQPQQQQQQHEHEQQRVNGTLQIARISRNDSMSRSRASLTSHSRSLRALFHTITARSPRSPTNGGGVGGRNIAFDFFHRTLNTKSFEQIECQECAGHKNSVVCMKIYPKPAKNTSASESSSVLVSGSRDCDIRVWKMDTFTKVNIKRKFQAQSYTNLPK